MTATAAAARRREMDATVGLLVFFGTTAMLFAALLLAYAVLRAQAPHWPPPAAPPLPRGLAGVNSLVLLGASAALWRARRSGPRSDNAAWLVAAGALGAGFLAGQILLWRRLVLAGLGQLPGQVFLALSALHALHVAAGLVVLMVSRRIRLVGLYWDFVLAVWIILYLAVCWL